MHRQLPRRVGLAGREGDHPPAAGRSGGVLQLRGLAAQRLEALADAPLLVFGLDQVLFECLAEALVAGDLRRRAKLRQRLQLDRVHVGQVLDELLVAVAIPLAGADAGLEVVEPGAGAVRARAAGSRRRGPRACPPAALPAPRRRCGGAPSRAPRARRSEDISGTFSAMSSQPGGVGCRRRLQLRSASRRTARGRNREAADAEPLGHLLGAERRLGGDVEGAVGRRRGRLAGRPARRPRNAPPGSAVGRCAGRAGSSERRSRKLGRNGPTKSRRISVAASSLKIKAGRSRTTAISGFSGSKASSWRSTATLCRE